MSQRQEQNITIEVHLCKFKKRQILIHQNNKEKQGGDYCKYQNINYVTVNKESCNLERGGSFGVPSNKLLFNQMVVYKDGHSTIILPTVNLLSGLS